MLFSLPPNLVGVISRGSFLYQVVEPISPRRSRIVAAGAFETPDPESSKGISALLSKAAARVSESLIPDFLPEDRWICERGQRAASGDFEPGVIVPMEHVITDFHHYLNRQLHGVTPPPVATSATVGIAKQSLPSTKDS